MSNKLIQIAREILAIEDDLPTKIKYSPKEKATINDFGIRIFSQTWGSTALGFGGVGGQAITEANTYVLIPEGVNQKCFVYFAGRYAYEVPYSEKFIEDVRKEKMEPVNRRGKYLAKD